MALTPEEKRKYASEYSKAWYRRNRVAAACTRAKWGASEKGKTSAAKYQSSDKGKETKLNWINTPVGQAYIKRYPASEKFKIQRRIYGMWWRKTEKGQALYQKHSLDWQQTDEGKAYYKAWRKTEAGKRAQATKLEFSRSPEGRAYFHIWHKVNMPKMPDSAEWKAANEAWLASPEGQLELQKIYDEAERDIQARIKSGHAALGEDFYK